jgi:hypothetical protein
MALPRGGEGGSSAGCGGGGRDQRYAVKKIIIHPFGCWYSIFVSVTIYLCFCIFTPSKVAELKEKN